MPQRPERMWFHRRQWTRPVNKDRIPISRPNRAGPHSLAHENLKVTAACCPNPLHVARVLISQAFEVSVR